MVRPGAQQPASAIRPQMWNFFMAAKLAAAATPVNDNNGSPPSAREGCVVRPNPGRSFRYDFKPGLGAKILRRGPDHYLKRSGLDPEGMPALVVERQLPGRNREGNRPRLTRLKVDALETAQFLGGTFYHGIQFANIK